MSEPSLQAYLDQLRHSITTEVLVKDKDRYIEAGGHQSLPWLFDFRRITLQPNTLEAFVALFFARFGHKYPFQVGGLETAAIPLVAALVSRSRDYGKPVNGFFIRKSRKKTGLLNLLEGSLTAEPIILIDDLINSGGSFMRQVEVLDAISREENRTVSIHAVFSILQFHETEAYSYFKERNISVDSIFKLTEFDRLIKQEPSGKKKIPRNHFETVWSWHGTHPSHEQVTPKSAVVTAGKKAFFATDNGEIIALALETGVVHWKHRLPKITFARHPLPTPLHCGKRIIIPSHDGNIYALDAETGERIWVNLDFDWCNNPLTTDGAGKIFGTVTRGFFKPHSYLVALDAETGKTLWATELAGVHGGSPTYLAGPRLILTGSHTGTLFACEAHTGTCVWQQDIGVVSTQPAFYHKERQWVIVSGLALSPEKDSAPVSVLEVNTGKIVYTYNHLQFGATSTPVVSGNIGIVTGLDKTLHAFDLTTGEPRWKTLLPARIFASPLICRIRSTEALYVGANDSTLYEIEISTGEITGMSLFTERIMNRVTFDPTTQLLLVPTYANEIYALRVKPAS